MKAVLPDTNIILWTFNGGPDFREAIKEAMPGSNIAIPNCVLKELKKLNTKHAKAALQICNTLPMNILERDMPIVCSLRLQKKVLQLLQMTKRY